MSTRISTFFVATLVSLLYGGGGGVGMKWSDCLAKHVYTFSCLSPCTPSTSYYQKPIKGQQWETTFPENAQKWLKMDKQRRRAKSTAARRVYSQSTRFKSWRNCWLSGRGPLSSLSSNSTIDRAVVSQYTYSEISFFLSLSLSLPIRDYSIGKQPCAST